MRIHVAPGQALACASLALTSFAFAQNDSPHMTLITTIKVKPEMRNEWVDLQKNEVIPAYKKAGIKIMSVWATALFGDSDEFTVVMPVAKFAEFDGESPLVKALGREASNRLADKLRRCTVSTRRTMVRDRSDLSIDELVSIPKYAMITQVQVKPAMMAEFESWLKAELLPNLKKGGEKFYNVSQVMMGGPLFQYTTVAVRDSFADLDKPTPLAAAAGEQGATKILTRGAAMINSVERYYIRLMPQLSYFPSPGTN